VKVAEFGQHGTSEWILSHYTGFVAFAVDSRQDLFVFIDQEYSVGGAVG
jgi:hypothetical protein